jgi:hypothetical protein
MAKRKPFFGACGRCFSIFVCVVGFFKALPKTPWAPSAPKTGCAVQANTPPLRRARSESRRTKHAFWAASAPSPLPNAPKAQYGGIDSFMKIRNLIEKILYKKAEVV